MKNKFYRLVGVNYICISETEYNSSSNKVFKSVPFGFLVIMSFGLLLFGFATTKPLGAFYVQNDCAMRNHTNQVEMVNNSSLFNTSTQTTLSEIKEFFQDYSSSEVAESLNDTFREAMAMSISEGASPDFILDQHLMTSKVIEFISKLERLSLLNESI